MKYVIFDLDGTLADIELRRKKAMQGDKMNWGVFFDPRNIALDRPNEDIVYLYHQMAMTAGVNVVIFSGRSDITQEATNKWFREYQILPPYLMRMRKDGDYSDDREIKTKWLEELLEEEKISMEDIIFVVDDRNKVVKMWRELGLTCLQVAEGDF